MTKIRDITGQRFGMLLVVKRTTDRGRRIKYLCKCDCGNEKVIYGENIRGGKSASCGCQIGGGNYKHGFTGTPEFDAWRNMLKRCTNPNARSYHNWGGRGIKICDRWLESFENFLADMGKRPHPKLSLERIDNDKGYEPSNCKWATRKEQNNNKRGKKLTKDNVIEIINLRKEGKTAKEIATKFNVDPTLIYYIEKGKVWQCIKRDAL